MTPSKKTGRVLSDLASVAREFQAAQTATVKAAAKLDSSYQTRPEFITYVPKKGRNAGKTTVKVGFRRADQPDNGFLAIKLYPSHARAILAAIDAGHRARLEMMINQVQSSTDETDE